MFSSRRNADFLKKDVLVFGITFHRNLASELGFEGLERSQIVEKRLENQNCTDWLDKGPCIRQSVPETTLGLQIAPISPQSAPWAGPTKRALLSLSFMTCAIKHCAL